jgi:hypothetical protein
MTHLAERRGEASARRFAELATRGSCGEREYQVTRLTSGEEGQYTKDSR